MWGHTQTWGRKLDVLAVLHTCGNHVRIMWPHQTKHIPNFIYAIAMEFFGGQVQPMTFCVLRMLLYFIETNQTWLVWSNYDGLIFWLDVSGGAMEDWGIPAVVWRSCLASDVFISNASHTRSTTSNRLRVQWVAIFSCFNLHTPITVVVNNNKTFLYVLVRRPIYIIVLECYIMVSINYFNNLRDIIGSL